MNLTYKPANNILLATLRAGFHARPPAGAFLCCCWQVIHAYPWLLLVLIATRCEGASSMQDKAFQANSRLRQRGLWGSKQFQALAFCTFYYCYTYTACIHVVSQLPGHRLLTYVPSLEVIIGTASLLVLARCQQPLKSPSGKVLAL